MIPSTEKQTKYYKESKLQSIPLMSIDAQSYKKILVNGVQQCIELYTVGIILQKPLNVVVYINRLKKKHHKMVSVDPEKAFDKIQHLYIIKTLSELKIEGNYLNVLKGIY